MSELDKPTDFALHCPLPLREYPEITLAHGAGGALTRDLIDHMIAPAFSNPWLDEGHDGAVVDTPGTKLAFTTDSYVIQPLVFPGGDIGHLAVCGTLNDLAMCGARPRHLSLGLIIEEGLPTQTLWQIIQSIAAACKHAGVRVVTGDTKVVDHGKGDGLFINMSGVGDVVAKLPICPARIQAGDAVLVSGDIGRHGIAVLSAREGLSYETPIMSDCTPVHGAALALLQAGLDIHCMRDLTRGGLATALIELAEASGTRFQLEESAIPVSDAVHGASELLGLDPFYIANEGRFCVVLPAGQAGTALEILKEFDASVQSSRIGEVVAGSSAVHLKTLVGSTRRLALMTGEHLPRIC